jgi:hypothetical protein
MSRRINSNNEELIGAHYLIPGSIVPCVVDDVHLEIEGMLIAVNTHSCKVFEVEAFTVRAAIAFKAERQSKIMGTPR